MSTSLEDQFIDETYTGLLHTSNTPISGSNFVKVYDGYGNQSPISLAKNRIKLGDVEYPTNSGNIGDVLKITSTNKAEWTQSQNILNTFYPIGCIYLSVTSTNPSETLGGSWTRVAQGRFLAGVGTGNDGTNIAEISAGNGAGEYLHKLTPSEIPSHEHEGYSASVASNGTIVSEGIPTRLDGVSSLVHEGGGHTGSLGVNKRLRLDGQIFVDPFIGADQPHNNIPPLFGIYVWQRLG
jgi:hypothetical protein